MPDPSPNKFRRLRPEELEEIEPQFVRFLAAQGIPADMWQDLKTTDEARVSQLLDQFSEMVFDDVIKRAEYFEQRGPRQLLTYHAGPDVITLRGITIEGETTLDLRREEPPQDMMARLQSSQANVKLLAAERTYRPDRAADLFCLLEANARIAKTSELYTLFDGLAKSEK